jgi:hypothetical protein
MAKVLLRIEQVRKAASDPERLDSIEASSAPPLTVRIRISSVGFVHG